MWTLNTEREVYFVLGVTDMRKSVNGLSFIVSDLLEAKLFSQSFFVFCNKPRNIIKILYWDRNGFCLWYKRLDKDKFLWPKDKSEVKKVTNRELSWLLEGLRIDQPYAHKRLNYREAF